MSKISILLVILSLALTVFLQNTGSQVGIWVPYIPPAKDVELCYWKQNGISYINVSIVFPTSGFNVSDWGSPVFENNKISADAKIWMYTGYQYPCVITLRHTYNLGKLRTGEYIFVFKAWGTHIKNITFTFLIVVPDDYLTIQEAINNANEEDVIYVRAGTYYENVVINKTISLIGENKNTTIIDGNATGSPIHITANSVNISGFKIRNSKFEYLYAGIRIDNSSNNNITDNIIINNLDGIFLTHSTNNTISNNIIVNNDWNGIHLKYNSDYNKISFNRISGGREGIRVEVDSDHNEFFQNELTNFEWIAIDLLGSSRNLIRENTLRNSHTGIYMSSDSTHHTVYHNNFIHNIYQVTCYALNNTWDAGYPFGGNYWSDYNGTDTSKGPFQNITGADGIGDTPYIINENNVDRYPLMNPWLNITVKFEPKIIELHVITTLNLTLEILGIHSVHDINTSSVHIRKPVVIYPINISIGDWNNNGVPDIIMQFDPYQIVEHAMFNLIENAKNYKLFKGFALPVKLIIVGNIWGLTFEASDQITLISKISAISE